MIRIHRTAFSCVKLLGSLIIVLLAAGFLSGCFTLYSSEGGGQTKLKRLAKLIPAFNAGISASYSEFSGSLLVNGAYDIYLDDANTIPLPGYTRLDLRFAYTFGKASVTADIFNLLIQSMPQKLSIITPPPAAIFVWESG